MKLLLIAAILLITLLSSAFAEDDAPTIKWGQTNAVIPYPRPAELPVREALPDLLTFEDGSPVLTARTGRNAAPRSKACTNTTCTVTCPTAPRKP